MKSYLWLLVRSGLRRNWGEWLFVAFLSGLTITVCASALTVSRLTLNAFPRMLDAVAAPDLTIGIGNPDDPGPPAPVPPEQLAALPGVAEMSLSRFTIGTEVDAEGRFAHYQRTPLIVIIDGPPALPLLRGRMPSADSPDEVALSDYAAVLLGVDVGDHIRYAVATRAELNEIGATGADHGGAIVEPIVIGVFGPVAVDGPVDAPTEQSLIVAGPAFLVEHPGIGDRQVVGVTLRDDTAVASFRRLLEEQFPSVDVVPRADAEAQARQAVEPEAYAVLAFGLMAGLIGLVVTGLTIVRQLTDGGDELTCLALGLNRRQRASQRWVQSLCAIAVGTMVGVIASMIVIDALGPIGVADAFDRGTVVAGDFSLAIGAGLAVAALLLIVAAASAWRSSRIVRNVLPATLPPAWVAAIISAAPSDVRTAAALSGRGTGAHRATRTALLGVATSVAVSVTVITFTASLDTLVSTPSLYGSDFDLAAWDGYGQFDDDVISAALISDEDVIELSRAAGTSGTVNGREAGMIGFDNFDVGAVVTNGNHPVAADEVMLGRRLARRLHVGVGDDVVVESGDAQQSYRVVGVGVAPGLTGDGAVFTLDGIHRVATDAEVGFQYVSVRPGIKVDDVVERYGAALACGSNCDITAPSPPPNLAYLDRTSSVPRLAVGSIVFLDVAISINALLIVGRRSRRAVAILRSVGATRRQVMAYLLSQVLLIVLPAVVLGVALGAIVGPLVWRRFADALGVVPHATANPTAVVVSITVLVVITTAVAGIPAWRTANRQVARELSVA